LGNRQWFGATGGEQAEYGKQILATVLQELSPERQRLLPCGKGEKPVEYFY